MPTQYIIYPSSSGGGATTVTADQGDPNTLANAWPVKVTDGVDVVQVSAAGEANVIVTSALPAGNNNIGDVDVASSVLPTGAATSANQTTEIGLLTSIDGNVIIADTDNVTVVSSVLPTGAATEATLLAIGADVLSIDGKFDTLLSSRASEATLSSINSNIDVALSSVATEATLASIETLTISIDNKTPPLGQDTMTNSVPVVIASDQSPISVISTAAEVNKVNLIRNDYTSVNVTTAAYVQLVASAAADISKLDVFDSSGQTLVFAVGAAASEVDQFYVYPGGNGLIYLTILTGQRLSIKAVSATANTGELVINTFS